MAERHKVPFTQKRAGESWESYGDRMALQVARLIEENRRLRGASRFAFDALDNELIVGGMLIEARDRLRAALASAEEKS